jgi:hypothetical protein
MMCSGGALTFKYITKDGNILWIPNIGGSGLLGTE